jgi:hypothetical protein
MLGALAVLGTVLGWLGAYATDEKWLVSAKVLLQIGPETAGTRPSMVGSPAPFLAGNPRREDVQTEVELLNNPDLLRRAFERLRAEDEAEALGPDSGAIGTLARRLAEVTGVLPVRTREQRALDKWASSLRIAVVPASTVLVVECRASQPAAAQRLLEHMLALYLEDHRAAFGGRGMSPVLGTLVTTREQVLADAESRLSKLREQERVVDVVQETSQLILARTAAETQVREVRSALDGARARFESLTSTLGITPDQLRTQQERAPNPVHDELELRLATARQALVAALEEFTADSPEVRRARESVAAVEAMCEHATATRESMAATGRNPLHDSLLDQLAKTRAQVAGGEAELATATRAVQELATRVLELEHARSELQKAEQDVVEAKKDLTQAHEGLRLARIEQALDESQIANVTVVARPGWLPTPMRSFGLPARLAIVLFGLFSGIGIGVLWLMWRSNRPPEPPAPLAAGP